MQSPLKERVQIQTKPGHSDCMLKIKLKKVKIKLVYFKKLILK